MGKESTDYSYEYENSSDEFIAGGITFRKEIFKDGSSYIGEFRDDEFHGQGTFTYANGNKYVGEFKNSIFNGQGTFVLLTGDRYSGEFRDDEFHGQGTFTYANGSKYVGEFWHDEFHGQGTMTFADGSKYVGEFWHDEFHGQGTMTFADGDTYTGEWCDGEMYGFGTSVQSMGRTTVSGDFVPTGEKYIGEMLNGMGHGDGIYHYANGDKYIGTWRHGEVVAGQGKIIPKGEQELVAGLRKKLKDIINHHADQNSASILKPEEAYKVN